MKFIKLWLPVFIWCYLIFYLSDIPGLDTGLGIYDLLLRKAAHIVEYFILTLLLYRAFRKSFFLSFTAIIFWSSFLSLLYAVSDEFHQSFIPNRDGNFGDVLIDAIGILLVVFIYLKKGERP
ncbi:MAG: hypothetical protein A2539_06400 [Elusimicrobia bacterium RIFOXYD2_FULL_34_15]|nr:MAG: hypothetical protein A2539_06400 [Elusimicrobia bacterium RIFOXYD2_FULL_34_15]HAM38459.1 hypothetical protein [Elusimicrobiota bacterium]